MVGDPIPLRDPPRPGWPPLTNMFSKAMLGTIGGDPSDEMGRLTRQADSAA